MKKWIALILTAMLALACIAGCAQPAAQPAPEAPAAEQTAEPAPAEEPAAVTYENYAYDKSWPEETLKLGVVLFNSADDTWLAVKDYYDSLTKVFNIEFIYSETISSAEQEFAFIDSCAAAGCKGIYAYYNCSGPAAIMEATSLGMYYVGTLDYYERFVDNELYIGGYSFLDAETGKTGDYFGGYQLGYTLGKQNVKHAVFCNGGASFGIQMFVERQQGFFDGMAAAQAEGSTTQFDPEVDLITGWPDAPTFAPQQTAALTADYDAVASSTDLAYWFQPVAESGKDIKMAAIGTVSDAYKPYVESGTVSCIVYDCPEYVHGCGMIMLINSCTGYPELSKNADGTPRQQHVYRWTIDSPELFNTIYDHHKAGEFYVTPQDVAMLFGGLNPNASLDLLDEVYDVTMEEAMARIG